MSHALLWVEALLTSLLWLATIVACAARLDRKTGSRLIAALIGVGPFVLAFAGLCILTATLKFAAKLQENWFVYALTLCLAYVIGATTLLIFAARRPAPGMRRAAAAWPRARLALGLLTMIAVGAMTLWNMDLEVRGQAGSLRNDAGTIMLSISPPNVGDSANAAFVYDKAFARLAADKSLVDINSPFLEESPDVKNPAIEDILKRHEITIKLLRKAATMPDCRFEHDYAHPSIGMMLPELGHARHAARLLALHAQSSLSHGQIGSALADLGAIFRMSEAVESEPIIISFLVSVSIDGIAVKVLQDVLPAVTSADQLAGLHIDDQSHDARMLLRSLQGEEAFGLSTFADLAGNQTDIQELTGLLTAEGSSPRHMPIIEPAERFLMRIFLISDDVAAYRELMHEYQTEASQPYYKTQHNNEPLKLMRRGLITSIIAPALRKTIESGARAQAIHSTAETAIAMTRYKLEHGAYPVTLEPLVPDYLDEIPADPFDGKPLRLAHKADQWIVYSIGPDGVDDGGTPSEHMTKKGDITFVLKAAK